MGPRAAAVIEKAGLQAAPPGFLTCVGPAGGLRRNELARWDGCDRP